MNQAQDHSFVGHLEDLRKRIIYVLIFFIVALAIALAFVGNVYAFLVRPVQGKLAVLGPGDVVQIYLMIAGVAALCVTTPFLLWQLWLFVSPGLIERERRYARRLILPVTVMFILGVSFGYFVVFPEIFHFLRNLAVIRFRFLLTATEYFSFMINIILPFGLLFELPVVVLFLTRIGLITPAFLRKIRRYAYLVCVILGTLISPPELISHLSVTVPMILVYEASIGISALAYKRKQKSEAWWRESSSPVIDHTSTAADLRDAVEDPLTQKTVTHQSAPVTPIVGSGESQGSQQLAHAPVLPRRPGIDVDERE